MATLNGAYNFIGRQKEEGHIAKKLHTPQRFVNIYSTKWANPIVWDIFESCAWRYATIWIAYCRVVNVPAGITFIFLHNVLSLSLFAINAAKIMFLCNSYKLNPLNCVIVFLASLEFYRQFRIDLSACKIVRHGVLLS